MQLNFSQQMKMSQQMKLAPRMIQSMEILQMSLAELEERIEQELSSNPTLEQADPGGDGMPRRGARRRVRVHDWPSAIRCVFGGQSGRQCLNCRHRSRRLHVSQNMADRRQLNRRVVRPVPWPPVAVRAKP